MSREQRVRLPHAVRVDWPDASPDLITTIDAILRLPAADYIRLRTFLAGAERMEWTHRLRDDEKETVE